MRKLIFAINLTIDGCCDHTKGRGSEEVHEFFTDLMKDIDLVVYGRKTYELMVPFWPDVAKNNSGQTKAINDFAHAFDAIRKIVVSQSLTSVEDKNTRIVSSNLADEISRLKQEPGKNIMTGGVALPTQLIELGLVDEYIIVVQPILAGAGRRLLENTTLQQQYQFKLINSKVMKSGDIALHYVQ